MFRTQVKVSILFIPQGLNPSGKVDGNISGVVSKIINDLLGTSPTAF
jgi:hypothetical protein